MYVKGTLISTSREELTTCSKSSQFAAREQLLPPPGIIRPEWRVV